MSGKDEIPKEKKAVEDLPKEHPRNVIPELCKQFYYAGLMTGEEGAISIKFGNLIYVTPADVPKEILSASDIFAMDEWEQLVEVPPAEKSLKISECTSAFDEIYSLRQNVEAIIYTHSKSAIMVSQLWRGEFKMRNHEIMRGIWHYDMIEAYIPNEMLVVPIVDKLWYDKWNKDISVAVSVFADCSAVIVRGHGLYVWGKTWQQAKSMTECYDRLFDIAIQLKQSGIDPASSCRKL